jgi:hypothetical protein
MIKYVKCRVIGTGKDGDPFRPEIADELDGLWSAVYHPKNPPYESCLVRITLPETKSLPKGYNEVNMKSLCAFEPQFKYKWLDQPDYPKVNNAVRN